jgi:adenylate cyclase
MQRKLAAILSADVEGYSRLMGEDEEATVRTLTVYRDVMASLVSRHRGRVVDAPGDNLLAEFASAVDALACAVEVQQALGTRNAALPDHRRMEFRIGINLGDVLVDGERIYGDGVNIAARVQDLAEAGGVAISGTTYDQVENKLGLVHEYLGEHAVKNIARPVRVYRVRLPRGPATPAEPPALEPPATPSIAVLPFVNMSRDPDQEYFSDGITEDLITDLSKLSGLFVIARNSTFTYKGRPVRVQQVGRELGVRYVLEGSVRRADDRVRITAQLVDAASGYHLWADRFDRRLDDIFAVQDEITRSIVEALAVTLSHGERQRRARKPTDSLDAYDCLLRGLDHYWRTTREANLEARRMFEGAIELDPAYAEAWAAQAYTHLHEWSMAWSQDPGALDRALECARRAVALDDSLPAAHSAVGIVYLWKKQHERAIAEAERAVALAPSDAESYYRLGEVLSWSRPEDAIEPVQKAMRLNPRYPFIYLWALGHACYLTRRYEDAVATLKRTVTRNPDWLPAHGYLAAACIESGREDEARAAAREVLRISPQITTAVVGDRLPYKDPAVLARALEAFRAAGLPES